MYSALLVGARNIHQYITAHLDCTFTSTRLMQKVKFLTKFNWISRRAAASTFILPLPKCQEEERVGNSVQEIYILSWKLCHFGAVHIQCWAFSETDASSLFPPSEDVLLFTTEKGRLHGETQTRFSASVTLYYYRNWSSVQNQNCHPVARTVEYTTKDCPRVLKVVNMSDPSNWAL